MSVWIGGLAEWTDGDTAYLSVAFTWLLNEARDRAHWYKALGYRVRAGGLHDRAVAEVPRESRSDSGTKA